MQQSIYNTKDDAVYIYELCLFLYGFDQISLSIDVFKSFQCEIVFNAVFVFVYNIPLLAGQVDEQHYGQ